MTWKVAASVGGKIAGSLLGGSSARKQAEAQARALAAAKGETTSAYNTSRGYYDPYYKTGTAASNRLAELMGLGGSTAAPGYGSMMRDFSMADYQQDPGYQFRLQEGLKQLQGAAGARGGLLSGATIRGGQKYSQDVASQEYGNAYQRYMEQQQNRYNMLAGQQGVGAQAGGNLANLSTNYGANMANYALKAGGIDAAKTAAKYSMYGDIANTGFNALGKYLGGKVPTTTPTQTGNVMSQVNSFDFNNPFQGMDPYKMY